MIARPHFGITILVSVAAALLLATSPWLVGFTGEAAGNAVLCGLLMLAFTVAALVRVRDWRSWMNLIPGVWVLLSPWIFGFATHIGATVIHVIIGLVVSVLAMMEVCDTEALCLED